MHLQIHNMATSYCDWVAFGLNFKPISERRFRNRLKESAITLESYRHFSFSCFLNMFRDRVIRANKMMNRAKKCLAKIKSRLRSRHLLKRHSQESVSYYFIW